MEFEVFQSNVLGEKKEALLYIFVFVVFLVENKEAHLMLIFLLF